MDEEDIGEYGIDPQVVRATKEYNTSKKRKKQVFSDGPIPGEPVLHSILTSGSETVGYMLLKNLGIKDKIRTVSDGRVYGCQMPSTYEISDDIRRDQYTIPEIYKEFLGKPKDNTFGIGYVGLDKNRFSLFPSQSSSNFVVTDKNKKMTITGQAFGVGAFEEEDEDIYGKEDMNKYDFELTGEKEHKKSVTDNKNLVFDLFLCSVKPLFNKKVYPPQIPHSFTGRHKVKKSRFEPTADEEEKPSTSRINPIIRAIYLGEQTENYHTEFRSLQVSVKREVTENSSTTNSNQNQVSASNSAFDIASLYLRDKFVSSSKKEDINNILDPVEKLETIHGTEQMREAVRMKMFGGLTRITSDWIPSSILCKRFNVPEPFVDRPEKTRTRSKNIIFEYQKHAEEEINLKPGLTKEQNEINTSETPENPDVTQVMEVNVDINNATNEDTVEMKNETVGDSPIDITKKIDIEKQQDLYKAIFLSSDSEPDDEEKEECQKQLEDIADNSNNARKEEIKATVLSDQLLPKIKPIKEGILSAVILHKFSKPELTVEATINDTKETRAGTKTHNSKITYLHAGLYGPIIPEKVSLKTYENQTIHIATDSDDEWIEKDDEKIKKKRKHKKEKDKKHKKKKKHRN